MPHAVILRLNSVQSLNASQAKSNRCGGFAAGIRSCAYNGHMRELSLERCPWARTELAIRYHDQEWGVPVHDDRLLLEFLVLGGAQAGLSWT